jgi:hypothetical protein
MVVRRDKHEFIACKTAELKVGVDYVKKEKRALLPMYL